MSDERLSPEAESCHQAAVDRGDDYYFDPTSGLLVMTEAYHQARGECCDSKCRHCPFGSGADRA